MLKKCLKCGKLKDESEFFNYCRYRFSHPCKACQSIYKKEYYQRPHVRKTHLEYMREYNKKYRVRAESKKRQRELEQTDRKKEVRKKYRQSPRAKKLRNERLKEYRKTKIKYRLDCSFHSAIYKALKGNKNGRKWKSLVDYTIEDLIKHLEVQFDKKMNWDNYGNYWEIDHIKPKSLFKYENAEDEEFKKCWALENLQPLEVSENRRKLNYY